VDEDFWLRLRQHFNGGDHNDDNVDQQHHHHPISLSMLLSPSPPLLQPTVPARIYWKAAHNIPMKQFTTQHHGHTALLPDGNIAIFCSASDGLIQIFNTRTFQFSVCEEGRSTRYGQSRLFYSNGFLVLERDNTDFVVWELEYDAQNGFVPFIFAVISTLVGSFQTS
jgi:hypothetical protein